MRSTALATLAVALAVVGLASCQQATHGYRDGLPAGTCVDFVQTQAQLSFAQLSFARKDCAEPHQFVVDIVIEHETDVVAEHRGCPLGDRTVEASEVPFGASVCLRPSN